jgi:hypothetical protein
MEESPDDSPDRRERDEPRTSEDSGEKDTAPSGPSRVSNFRRGDMQNLAPFTFEDVEPSATQVPQAGVAFSGDVIEGMKERFPATAADFGLEDVADPPEDGPERHGHSG